MAGKGEMHMLSAALFLLANSLFLTLRLTGDTGSFPKPLSAGEERMYLERSLAVALVGVRLVGLNTYVVLSGSMEPTYHTGSLLYVKSVDPQDLRVGDPITFMLNEDTVATHRIIEILPDEEDSSVLRFRTQGTPTTPRTVRPCIIKTSLASLCFPFPIWGISPTLCRTRRGCILPSALPWCWCCWCFCPICWVTAAKRARARAPGRIPRPITKG